MPRLLESFATPAMALLVSVIMFVLFVLGAGNNPLSVMQSVYIGAFGS